MLGFGNSFYAARNACLTSTNVYGYYTDIQVEQGMTFNMGDLFQYSQYKNNKEIKGGYLSDLSSGVSYKSSNKNVITVSSKGDITVRRPVRQSLLQSTKEFLLVQRSQQ